MTKTFGVKEARAAGEFAKTKEQKLTVLAVVKMLGMTVNLTTQVRKQTGKLTATTKAIAAKIGKLQSKTNTLQFTLGRKTTEKLDLYAIDEDWSV